MNSESRSRVGLADLALEVDDGRIIRETAILRQAGSHVATHHHIPVLIHPWLGQDIADHAVAIGRTADLGGLPLLVAEVLYNHCIHY